MNKLTRPDGTVVKKKDMLAPNDRLAVKAAREDADCPVCEVLREGKKVASIY
ncbi:MAG: hypothetical protein H0W74_13960 [Sphingosinicella sp.]|nr:hypothetical protein [Sphingosinicella sp.]